VSQLSTPTFDNGRVTITGSIDEARQRLVRGTGGRPTGIHTTPSSPFGGVDVRTLNEMSGAPQVNGMAAEGHQEEHERRPSVWEDRSS